MKTLIIVSHPQLSHSSTQAFLKTSQSDINEVTWHPLNQLYADFKIDAEAERRLLMQYDRIILQFPLYWYSAPALLKQWEDEVLIRRFANATENGALRGKELGIVTSIGVPKKEYQSGMSEHFTVSEIMKPYQALAYKCGMKFLPIFTIDQFAYMTPEQKSKLLIQYRNYINNPKLKGFDNYESWIVQQLENIVPQNDDKQSIIFNAMIDEIKENQHQLDNLKWQTNLMKNKEEE